MADQVPSQNQAGVQTDWEAKAKELENQVRGVSTERDKVRREVNAWKAIAQDAGDVIQYDPTTGYPVGWNVGEEPVANNQAWVGSNPFSGIVEDPNSVNQYFQGLVNSQGYLTQPQADELARQYADQAYQTARLDFLVLRNIDKLLSNKDYSDLQQYGSDWSKRTSQVLQERGWAKPIDGAASWDQWFYADPSRLQEAADIAQARMFKESQTQQAASQEANQNQQAAGLSVGNVSGAPEVTSEQEYRKALESGSLFDRMRQDTEKNAYQAGLIKK